MPNPACNFCIMKKCSKERVFYSHPIDFLNGQGIAPENAVFIVNPSLDKTASFPPNHLSIYKEVFPESSKITNAPIEDGNITRSDQAFFQELWKDIGRGKHLIFLEHANLLNYLNPKLNNIPLDLGLPPTSTIPINGMTKQGYYERNINGLHAFCNLSAEQRQEMIDSYYLKKNSYHPLFNGKKIDFSFIEAYKEGKKETLSKVGDAKVAVRIKFTKSLCS